jgi:hypothetical protein
MSGAFVKAINDLDEEAFHPMTAMSPGVKILLPAELLPVAVLLGWSCIAEARCLSWRRASGSRERKR